MRWSQGDERLVDVSGVVNIFRVFVPFRTAPDWRKRHAFTLDSAARRPGLSRRMVAYHDRGTKPIPRVVALATRASEMG